MSLIQLNLLTNSPIFMIKDREFDNFNRSIPVTCRKFKDNTYNHMMKNCPLLVIIFPLIQRKKI